MQINIYELSEKKRGCKIVGIYLTITSWVEYWDASCISHHQKGKKIKIEKKVFKVGYISNQVNVYPGILSTGI